MKKLDAPARFFIAKNWMLPHDFSSRKIGCSRTIFLPKNWMLPHDFSPEKLDAPARFFSRKIGVDRMIFREKIEMFFSHSAISTNSTSNGRS